MAVVGFGVDTIFVTVKISEVSKYLMILLESNGLIFRQTRKFGFCDSRNI